MSWCISPRSTPSPDLVKQELALSRSRRLLHACAGLAVCQGLAGAAGPNSMGAVPQGQRVSELIDQVLWCRPCKGSCVTTDSQTKI